MEDITMDFGKKLYRVLVIYDIVDSKNRYRINKIMGSYGVRIQKSAFECYLSLTQVKQMENKLRKALDSSVDRLDIYRFTDYARVESIGQRIEVAKEELIVI